MGGWIGGCADGTSYVSQKDEWVIFRLVAGEEGGGYWSLVAVLVASGCNE